MARWIGLVALQAVVLLGATLFGWWLVGDLSYTGDAGSQGLDYLVRPPDLSDGLVKGAAVAGALLVVGGVVGTLALSRRRALRWLGLLAGWMVVGVVLAAFARTVTAGVIGANIGAGLVFLFGLPLVAAAAATLVVLTVRSRRSLD